MSSSSFLPLCGFLTEACWSTTVLPPCTLVQVFSTYGFLCLLRHASTSTGTVFGPWDPWLTIIYFLHEINLTNFNIFGVFYGKQRHQPDPLYCYVPEIPARLPADSSLWYVHPYRLRILFFTVSEAQSNIVALPLDAMNK